MDTKKEFFVLFLFFFVLFVVFVFGFCLWFYSTMEMMPCSFSSRKMPALPSMFLAHEEGLDEKCSVTCFFCMTESVASRKAITSPTSGCCGQCFPPVRHIAGVMQEGLSVVGSRRAGAATRPSATSRMRRSSTSPRRIWIFVFADRFLRLVEATWTAGRSISASR